MSSSQHPLRQSGIYRNLPSFDGATFKNLRALVCGATGISGFHTIRALLDSPKRWSQVFALSRRPMSDNLLSLFTEEQRSRIQHVSVDLGASPEDIAQSLSNTGVAADYVFYYAYLTPKTGKSAMDPSMAEDLIKANVLPFDNFLNSLPIAGIKPQRILLQTGGKNYGMHIGRVRTPVVESDPQPRHLTDNFYYHQEKLLRSFCDTHEETDWNMIRPAAIIGATESAAMNTFLSFGVYAAVQAHKQQPLVFGSDFQSWQFEGCHSTARLTGYLSEWAVLEDRCANESFNAQDGGTLSWDRFFHELARWFGVREVRGPEIDKSKFSTVSLAGGEEAPLGYGPPMVVKYSYRLSEWAQDPSNQKSWDEMMEQSHGRLTKSVWNNGPQDFALGDFTYLPFGTLSMNKARRFGFCGFVDTLESVFETYQEMAHLGLLPPMKVGAARALV